MGGDGAGARVSLWSEPLLLVPSHSVHVLPQGSEHGGTSWHGKELPLHLARHFSSSSGWPPWVIHWLSPFPSGVAPSTSSSGSCHAGQAGQGLLPGHNGRLVLLALRSPWQGHLGHQQGDRLGHSGLASQFRLPGKGSLSGLESAHLLWFWTELSGEISGSEEGEVAFHLQAVEGARARQGGQ